MGFYAVILIDMQPACGKVVSVYLNWSFWREEFHISSAFQSYGQEDGSRCAFSIFVNSYSAFPCRRSCSDEAVCEISLHALLVRDDVPNLHHSWTVDWLVHR